MTTKPVVIAGMLLGYEAFLEKRLAGAHALLGRSGFSSQDFADPQSVIEVESAARLFEDAARATGEPCLALDWAENIPLGATGTFFYLFINSKTIGEGMRTVAAYSALLKQAVNFQFEDDPDGATLWWRWPMGFDGPYTQVSAFGAALFVIRMRLITAPDWTPVSVELQGEALQCAERVRWMFGPNVKHRSNRNSVRVDAETMNLPIPQADPRLRQMLQSLSQEMIGGIAPAPPFLAQVSQIIATLLSDRRATLEEVARSIGCSPRTLQNRLTQAGTSFERMLNDSRKAKTELLLRRGDVSMSQIANELGFSELSAFTRAAQRWYGMSPSAYRKLLKE